MKSSLVAVALAAAALVSAAAPARAADPGLGVKSAAHLLLVVDGNPLGPLASVVIGGVADDPGELVTLTRGSALVKTRPLPSPRKTPTLTVTALGQFDRTRSTLASWHALVVGGSPRAFAKTIELELVDASGKRLAGWSVQRAWPSRLTVVALPSGTPKLTVVFAAASIAREQ